MNDPRRELRAILQSVKCNEIFSYCSWAVGIDGAIPPA